MERAADEYSRRVESQIRQYESEPEIHDLPGMFHLWANSFLALRMRAVFGVSGTADFYAGFIAEAIANTGVGRVLSIGAGDATTEIAVARALRARGIAEFRIDCLEISPVLVARADAAIRRHEVTDLVRASLCDINEWRPDASYGAVIAHHSLHHIVALERVFDGIDAALADGGYFLTQDMIGRNGHMRWPETLAALRHIWRELPGRFKYNHQLRRFEDDYEDWDCSTEGFEGIRAQDILPLCVERFSFRRFLAWGGLVEVLLDRNFGPNFDPADPFDREIVRSTQVLEDRLIDEGHTKPTSMAAVMVKRGAGSAPIVFRRRTPEFCVRSPIAAAPSLPPLRWQLPESASGRSARLPRLSTDPVALDFGRPSSVAGLKRTGWYPPEPEVGGSWSRGRCATLALHRGEWPARPVFLHFQLSPYVAPGGAQEIEVSINGSIAAVWRFTDGMDALCEKRIAVGPDTAAEEIEAEGDLLIAFQIRQPRDPSADGGEDMRPLGFLLRHLTIAPALTGELPDSADPAAWDR